MAMKPPSINPTIYSAVNKKIDPLIAVPITVNTGALIFPFTLFLTSKNNPKNISAVIGLSMMLANCPPGTVVVSADTTPVTIDKSTTYFVFGKSMIPKNIIANHISGLIPNNIGGATACSTAPIPTSNDKITKIRVFNFTSPHLNYTFYFPTVHSLSVAETYLLL